MKHMNIKLKLVFLTIFGLILAIVILTSLSVYLMNSASDENVFARLKKNN